MVDLVFQITYTPLSTKSDPVKLIIVGNSTSYSLGFSEGKYTDLDAVEITYTATFDSVSMSVMPVKCACLLCVSGYILVSQVLPFHVHFFTFDSFRLSFHSPAFC